MSDFNKSPQIHHSTGNNENETENQRNLPPKNKHFMSPTISAASKFTPTPKKKVFSEWRSPKSLPKVPKSAVHSHKINDNVAIVDDSFDVPYDPLTNYLSPRPRFLRYRPKRRREIVVKSDIDSLTDSVESSSTLECENEEILTNDEHSVVGENELVEEFEFEEENSGFRWGLVKFFIVFLGLVYGTMWISCMNSSVPMLELGGFRLVDGNFVDMNTNVSLRIVSLSSLDSGKVGVFELDEKVVLVDQTSDVQETNGDAFGDGQAVFDEGSLPLDSMTEHINVETEAPILASVFSEIKIHDSEPVVSVVGIGVESVVLDSKTGPGHEPVEMEAPIESDATVVVGSGIDNVVLDSKTECEQVEIKAPIDPSVENEWPGLDDSVVSEVGLHDSEANISCVELAHGLENATEISDETIEAEIRKEYRTVQTEYDQVEIVVPIVVPGIYEESDGKLEEGELSNESEVVAEEKQSETTVKQMEVVESEQFRLTFRELLWPVISPLIAFGLLASLLLKFYCKCKRASSRSRSSYVKLCSSAGKTAKVKPGLPPRALEKTAHSEVRPPSSINPQEHLDMDDIHTIIPRVKQLGEFEVGVEFTRSLKRCSAKTGMEPRDETVYSTPDTQRTAPRRASIVQPSSSDMSTAESYSRGSDISHGWTLIKDVKEELIKATPTPRRSTRLRNKGVTSP